ncbi:hypothetical protein CC79DRAFT_1355536 [Sarocladium strictum]
MLFRSSFISAIAALSLASGLATASPIVVRHENGTVEFQDEHLDANNELVSRKIWLHKFSGCTDVQQHLIETSWRQMLSMAEKIKGKVNFNEKVAVDFLGNPKRNKDKQKDIRAMIESVATWQLGGRIDWHLVMTCDDPIRTRRLRFTEFPEGCPKGTPKEDYHKCASRCWNSVKKSDGTLLSWKPAAAAYTESWRTTDVGQINFCPGFFNTKTCVDVLHKWGNFRGEDKWNMVNYQCREQLLVHELFHIDANWQHHAPGVGRVIDRSFKIKDYNGNVVVRKAYGPLYTKILARWSKDVGHFVVTNADNLAFYFLGKWLSEHAGFYPPDPVPDTVPVSIDDKRKRGLQRRQDVWDPIHVVDGQLQLGDKEDVAAALSAESPEEALEMYANDNNDELECTNFISEGEEDPEPDCGDDGNEPLELDISQDPPRELEEPDRPDPTDIPTVAAECIHTTMSFEGTSRCFN